MDDSFWILLAAAGLLVLSFVAARSTRRRELPVEVTPAPVTPTGEAAPAVPPAEEAAAAELPRLSFEEDAALDPTRIREAGIAAAVPAKIVYDEDAAIDEPTRQQPLIVVTATAHTDKGLCRKRNEDSVLVREDDGLFVVADGMGGYRGGELASSLAVSTIEGAFAARKFEGPAHDTIPARASELARAIQMANRAILRKASVDKRLEGMGTTICAARFSANKQRVYIGHVGDSRVYCLRNGTLRQMTSDHTMRDFGIVGAAGAHLSRAVGIWPSVPIDIILAKPRAGDVYLLCSDGLTKMVSDAEIERVLKESSPGAAVQQLIRAANDHGGKDNISIVVVSVDEPRSAA